MQMKTKNSGLALAGVLAAALAACSGGGDSPASVTAPAAQISGKAANGAAFTGGVVYVYDSRGQVVGTSGPVDSAGNYSVTLAAGAVAPFVLVALRTTAEGQQETLVSVATSMDQTTANITPITSLIASRLSPSGDPAQLATELTNGASITPQAVAAAITEINAVLEPLLTATGTSGTDPLTTSITTDGTGYDRLLDSLSITFRPTSDTTTNIEIVAKTAVSDSSTPVVTSFSNTSTALQSLPPVNSADLVASGTSAAIQNLLAQLNACLQVPLGDRVSGTTAASITSQTCKDVFVSGDPTLFKHNSYVVSSTEAFKGIFSATPAALVTFERPRYEYTVANGNTSDTTRPMDGDVVFTASWSDANGNSDSGEYWARPDGNGRLYLSGNRSGIDAEVSARMEWREFLHPNLAAYTHINVGFNVFVNAKHTQLRNSLGTPVPVAYIKVTTPRGSQLTLKRVNGYGYYELMTGPSTSAQTSVVKLAGRFIDPATPGLPRDVEPAFWAKRDADCLTTATCEWTDADITAIPAQSKWVFDAYDSGNNLITSFSRRTTNRPLTVTEASQVKWPRLVSEVKAGLTTAATTAGSVGWVTFPSDDYADVDSGTDGSGPGWEAAVGAWLPTNFKVYGSDPLNTLTAGLAFDDVANFRSTARRTRVTCSLQGGSDQHCVGDKFKAGVKLGQVQMNGRDAIRQQFSVSYRTQAGF